MINRRSFIAKIGGLATGLIVMGQPWQHSRAANDSTRGRLDGHFSPRGSTRGNASIKSPAGTTGVPLYDEVADGIAPSARHVSRTGSPEVLLDEADKITLQVLFQRLSRVQAQIGHGNFNIVGWDQTRRLARRHDQIGSFSAAELKLVDAVFSTSATALGFYGDKVVADPGATIDRKNIVKIAGSGHFLFKGKASDTYKKVLRDLGGSVILTSGVRGQVKQLQLFLAKAVRTAGNLTLASRSVAPPGYSYHALGDFDIGIKGFGGNFTEEFARTDEFKRLTELGYLDFRYPEANAYGVRYEPWHIKIV